MDEITDEYLSVMEGQVPTMVAEVRRLRAVNNELLSALRKLHSLAELDEVSSAYDAMHVARAILARHDGKGANP